MSRTIPPNLNDDLHDTAFESEPESNPGRPVQRATIAPRPGSPGPAPQPPAEVKFHSIEAVAAMLALPVAEVRDIIRSGELPAREVRGRWFITADRLGAFMNKTSDRRACSRFKAGEPVLALTDEGHLVTARFIGEATDGSLLVERDGLFGTRREAYPVAQVQPLTVRPAAAQVQ